MNGVLVINKPAEFTSFDVVAVVRKLSGQRKIGHTGTLDPNATGVLPLLLGNATKAQDIIVNHDKEYLAGFKLGYISNTLDIWGEVEKTKAPDFSNQGAITEQDILNVIPEFTGEINQIPPMFSAIQKDGKRLYDLARQGIEIEREPRKVTIYSLELVSFNEQEQTGNIRVKCSKGTYIRTLIDDIGKKLSCGAVMNHLERINACGYEIDKSYTLDEIKAFAENGELKEKLMSTESLFLNYGYVAVSDNQAKRFSNGGALDISRTYLSRGYEDKQIYRVKDRANRFLGLGIADKESNQLKIFKLFL